MGEHDIADYAHFSEKYQGRREPWIAIITSERNLEKAKVYFQEVKRMLAAHEHWFGHIRV